MLLKKNNTSLILIDEVDLYMSGVVHIHKTKRSPCHVSQSDQSDVLIGRFFKKNGEITPTAVHSTLPGS